MLFPVLFVAALAVECKYRGVDFSFLTRDPSKPYTAVKNNIPVRINVCGEVLRDNKAQGDAGVVLLTDQGQKSTGKLSTQRFQDAQNALVALHYSDGDYVGPIPKLSSTVLLQCDVKALDAALEINSFSEDTAELVVSCPPPAHPQHAPVQGALRPCR